MLETVKCVCGDTVEYNNPSIGATCVGHFEHQTGWKLVNETYYGKIYPTCPKCRLKAQLAVQKIKKIYGTLYISLVSI